MRKTARNVLSLLIVLAFAFNTLPFGSAHPVQASSSGVVISQVYGGGGNTGAPYTHDFIELFNAGSAPVSLNGWSVQYGSAAGSFGTGASMITALGNVTLQPGQYYLIQEAAGTGTGIPGLPTPDLIAAPAIAMSGTNGKVALVNEITGLNCGISTTPCSDTQMAKIIDLVGFGSANMFEGAAATPVLSNTTAAIRNNNGCTDTDQNGVDFTAVAPNPRNSASPLNVCSSTPALSINDVTKIEGDAGTTTFDFTVSLTIPAGAGGVTFDLTTADGTATIVDNDYVTNVLTGQTIPAGGITYTFSVLVNGDEATEADETFKVTISNVVGAAVADGLGVGKITDDDTDYCATAFTPIYQIQGSGMSAAVTGNVTTQGVVVGDFETSALGSGFYLQDVTGDNDPATSDGIFVFTDNANLVSLGQVVRVTGYARERFGQTTLNSSNSDTAAVAAQNVVQCAGSGSVPAVDVTMPFADAAFPERYEGMLVHFPQNLVIAEYFEYDRYGEVVLSLPLDGESRPFTGTAIDEPGTAANARALANSLRRITLDDNNSKQNPDVLRHPNGLPFSLENRFRGGDTVGNTVGVLGYGFSKYRIFPTGPAEYTSVNPRPAAPEEVGGEIRVSAMNTLNYFVTPDYPSGALDNKCGPANNQECRGWDSDEPNELSRQRAKLIEALNGLNADVIGLNELENSTGVEPLADIVAGLPGYAYINTGTIGTDAIKVGMIYRTAAVTPVGSFKTIDSTVDPRFLETKNRPSLAQTFQVNATGEKFTVVVNHFKSKGSDCNSIGDPDTGDGQGNCSQTRANAAAALVDWLATDPTGSGDHDFIILGDLNSYAMEDTIDAIKAGADDAVDTDDDYTNLIARYQGTHAYSYTFDGQAGYLDHALASASMAAQVTGATEWHINSDEPDILDYDTTFKPTAQEALYEVNQFRTSDHDPVIVGLALGTPPEALDDAYETDEDDGLTVDAPGVLENDTDDNGDTLTVTLDAQPQNGNVVMESTGKFTYTPVENFHGTDTFTYTVSDGELTDTGTVTIEVEPVNDAPVAVGETYEMDEDTELTILAPGLLANDSDVDGDPLILAAISGPQHGQAWINTDGRFDYIPNADFHGTETLTYTIFDGELTASATITIEVEAVNDKPVATDDAYETNEDTPLVIAAPGVLSNDTDVDVDTLTAQEFAGPKHGTLAMTPDGGFLYTPSADFNGIDTFTYTVSDGELTDTATVTINVKSIDDGYNAVITKNKLSPEEGELVTFTAHLVDLDTQQPVDFSDGAVFDWFFETGHTGSGEVNQHAFTDEDTYVVSLIVDDPVYGIHTATTTVPVKNANPTIDTIAPITIAQREWVEAAGAFTDPGQDEQFTATVDYGDGTGAQPLSLGDGTFNLTHQYFTAGDFTITIVLDDGDGGEDTLTISVTVEGRQIIFLPVLHN